MKRDRSRAQRQRSRIKYLPISRVTLGRETRVPKIPVLGSMDIGTPSSGTRRVLKREAVVGAKSKYFRAIGVAPGEEEGERRKMGKIARRK